MAPGPRLVDFGHAVWCLGEVGEQGGDLVEQARRVRLLCDAYGWKDGREVIDEIEARVARPLVARGAGVRRGRAPSAR